MYHPGAVVPRERCFMLLLAVFARLDRAIQYAAAYRINR
jgi:hypothetical protein